MRALYRIVPAILLPVLLGGCFEVTEDIVIRKDGSALVELEVSLVGSLAMIAGGLDKSVRDPFGDASKVVRDLKVLPGVKKVDHSEKKDGTKRVHRLVVELENYESLSEVGALLMKYQRERVVDTEFVVQRVPPYGARITQRLTGQGVKVKTPTHLQGMPVGPMMEGKDAEAKAYLLRKLEGKYLYITLRAPEIGDTNGELNKSGTVVTWDVPLTTVLESPGRSIDLAADITVARDDRPLWKRVIFFWK